MSGERARAEEAIAKSMRLRGTSPTVTRLSRRALIVTGAVVSTGLFVALGWSLADHRRATNSLDERPTRVMPSERVTALPKGYDGPVDAPLLGPPLPGDLGRPLLKAQREGRLAPVADPVRGAARPEMAGLTTAPSAPKAARSADPRLVARQSGLFAAATTDARPATTERSTASTGPSDVADPRTTSAERLQPPASPYVLQAGAIIPAALVTGLRSDTPGVAIAQVSQDVHDSLGGGVLLIPAGSRLIGAYDAEVTAGQSRLRVGWTRLILPSGRSIVLDKLPAADEQGMGGLQDGVDRHGGHVLAAAGLSTVLAIGAEAGTSSGEGDLARALRRGVSGATSQVGQQVVGKSLDLAPTLTIRPGAPLRVLLTRDLVLEPYREGTVQ